MSDTPVVILCRPQIGENIGTTARAMANFGLVDLRLVRPDCGWPNAKAVAAASGAMGVLNDIERFDALNPAVADLHHIFATTARPRELNKDVLTAEEAAARARTRCSTRPATSALVAVSPLAAGTSAVSVAWPLRCHS